MSVAVGAKNKTKKPRGRRADLARGAWQGGRRARKKRGANNERTKRTGTFSAWQEAQKVRRINSANGANKKKAVRVAKSVAGVAESLARVKIWACVCVFARG